MYCWVPLATGTTDSHVPEPTRPCRRRALLSLSWTDKTDIPPAVHLHHPLAPPLPPFLILVVSPSSLPLLAARLSSPHPHFSTTSPPRAASSIAESWGFAAFLNLLPGVFLTTSFVNPARDPSEGTLASPLPPPLRPLVTFSGVLLLRWGATRCT